MNITDLQILLTIPKEQIIFYEKNEILIPKKDTSSYTWQDVTLLKLCIELESIHISVENIKKIITKTCTIKECLPLHIEYTEPQLKYANYMLECFYNNNIRKKLYFGYQTINSSRLKEHVFEEQLIFKEDNICLSNINGDTNKMITIDYSNIIKVVFMIVNRAPCRMDFKNKKFGIPHLVYGNGGVSPYYIDLDILEDSITHKFESVNQDNIIAIFELLQSKHIHIEDPLQVYNLFKTTSSLERMKFFERNYKTWATKYHLENPRKETLESQLLLQKKINNKILL